MPELAGETQRPMELIAISRLGDVYKQRMRPSRVEGEIRLFDEYEFPATGPGSVMVNVLVVEWDSEIAERGYSGADSCAGLGGGGLEEEAYTACLNVVSISPRRAVPAAPVIGACKERVYRKQLITQLSHNVILMPPWQRTDKCNKRRFREDSRQPRARSWPHSAAPSIKYGGYVLSPSQAAICHGFFYWNGWGYVANDRDVIIECQAFLQVFCVPSSTPLLAILLCIQPSVHLDASSSA
jgi:hypothetical protein